MYLALPENILPGQRVRIKYDCDGGFKLCGTEATPIYKTAKKNADSHGGKHICRSCQLAANNPVKRKKIQEKIKKTNLERYGTENPLNTADKIAARVEKMFGTQEAIDARTEKTKKTMQERFGADHIMKTEEGVRRLTEAMQERYGVDFPLQNEGVQEKMRQTCQERYGVDNPLSSPEIRAKAARTTLEKYGVEYYNQLPEMREYLRENCPMWLTGNYQNPWNKGIIRPEEWNNKQRQTVMVLMDQGKWNVGPKFSIKGRYHSRICRRQKPMFRSSYELKVHWHLDNDPDVDWYDYEPFRVSYTDTEGKKRYYVIDFVIKYRSKPRPLALEVKNDYNKDRFVECGKQAAFQEECGGVLDFAVWSNDEISALGLDLDELLSSPLVEQI